VRDQDKALEFYTKKLGFSITTDQPFNDKQRWIELKVPGADTGVVLFTPEGTRTASARFTRSAFWTSNVAENLRRARVARRRVSRASDDRRLGKLGHLSGSGRQSVRAWVEVEGAVGRVALG
jgi:catechol 2,3-dioxygenase-like lactoylglutathione lyase family enzyme